MRNLCNKYSSWKKNVRIEKNAGHMQDILAKMQDNAGHGPEMQDIAGHAGHCRHHASIPGAKIEKMAKTCFHE